MNKLLLAMGGILMATSVCAEENSDVVVDEAVVDECAIGSGFSIGAGVGVEWSQTKGQLSFSDDDVVQNHGEKNKKNANRVLGTVSLGYNHVFGKFLAGVGGAYSFGEKKTNHVLYYDEDTNSPNVDGGLALRTLHGTPEVFGKFGFICCPKSLIYMKIGAAWQRTKYIDTIPGNDYVWEGTQTKVAPKISLGYEQKVSKSVSLFAEYGYTFNTKKTYHKDHVNGVTKYTAHDELKKERGHSVTLGVAYNIGLK